MMELGISAATVLKISKFQLVFMGLCSTDVLDEKMFYVLFH